jgi:hypothetical protein
MIETLTEWNTRLGYCGCCPMPVCPVPEVLCEDFTTRISLRHAYAEATRPVGPFDLSLWKVYRTYTAVREVEVDYSTAYPPGSLVETGLGSSLTTRIEDYDTFYAKYPDCGPAVEQVKTITHSGGGSFTITGTQDYPCGGEPNNSVGYSHVDTYSYVGNQANPAPPPDNYPNEYYQRDTVSTLYYYSCEGGVLTLSDTEVFPSTDFHLAHTIGVGIDPRTITNTYTVENEITWAAWLAGAVALLPAMLAEQKAADCWSTGQCLATYKIKPPPNYPEYNGSNASTANIEPGTGIRVTPVRFRFRIPTSHTGSVFTITYDVLEEPDGWDATIDDASYVPPVPNDPPEPIPQIPDPAAPARSWVSRDNAVSWTGPGTPVPAPIIVGGVVTNQAAIDAAEATWLTPWVEIAPPTVEGERRVVNTRYTCYSGTKYGVKPQTMGEGVELPEP